MHPIQFGYCVPIFAWPGGGLFRTPNFATLDSQVALRTARAAEALNYDSIWVADHLMLGKDQAILDGWTTISAIAGATSRARLGVIHQGHFFRYPSVTAKMIATLDNLSAGRFIYFADTGTRAAEHHAYGLNYPLAAEDRMPDFIEGLELALALWKTTEDKPLTFEGRYHHVNAAVCTPSPISQPHPPIWFGEAHPLTLEACARYGQGWNSVPVGLTEMKQRLTALRAACQRIGRDFGNLEISYEVQALIASSRDAVRDRLRHMVALTPPGNQTPQDADFRAFVNGETDNYPDYLTKTGLVGTPAEIKSQMQDYLDIGVTHFMLWFMDAPDLDGMTLFAEQVAPAFKIGQ